MPDVQQLLDRADARLRDGASREVLDGLFDDLRLCVREDSTSLEVLAPLFERLSRARKRVADGVPRWMPVGQGHLSLGPRPKLRRVERLAHHGATHVLTLLSERERVTSLEEATREAGMEWLWFPLRGGTPPQDARAVEVLFRSLDRALEGGAKIYVHCAAGIHRTGMITYAYLRWSGLSAIEATAGLGELRAVTAAGVGDERKRWGDDFGPNLAR